MTNCPLQIKKSTGNSKNGRQTNGHTRKQTDRQNKQNLVYLHHSTTLWTDARGCTSKQTDGQIGMHAYGQTEVCKSLSLHDLVDRHISKILLIFSISQQGVHQTKDNKKITPKGVVVRCSYWPRTMLQRTKMMSHHRSNSSVERKKRNNTQRTKMMFHHGRNSPEER